MSTVLPAYAEMHCRSNFSFGVGASHPESKKWGLTLLPGAEFELPVSLVGNGFECQRSPNPASAEFGGNPGGSVTVVALAHDLAGWGDLCEFITQARRSAPKGQ